MPPKPSRTLAGLRDAIGCRVRSAKNVLQIINRTTKRLGIRDEENVVQRSTAKTTSHHHCIESGTGDRHAPFIKK